MKSSLKVRYLFLHDCLVEFLQEVQLNRQIFCTFQLASSKI